MATKKLLMSHANNPNVRKFLDVIAQAEGATGYDTAFGGGVISDLSDHPRTLHDLTQTDGRSNKTSAAGRYQFLSKTWDDVAGQLGLTNFGPASQDLAAIELLRRNGSLDAVLAGDFDTAIRKSGTTWASLPSSTYPQPKRSEGFIRNALEGAANAIFPAAQAENIPEQGPWSKYGANPSEAQANAPQGPWSKYANQPTQQDGPWSKYSNSETAQEMAPPMRVDMAHEQKPAESSFFEQLGSTLMELPRQAGLMARYGIEGMGQAAGVFTEPLRQGLNVGLRAAGFPEAASTADLAAQASDFIGLPQPETANERVIGDATRLMAGAGGLMGGTQALARGATGVTQAVLGTLSSNPAHQLASASGAGIAGGSVREAGGSPTAQAVASLAGGVVAPSALSTGQSIVRNVQGRITDVEQRVRSALAQMGTNFDTLPARVKTQLQEEAARALRTSGELNPEALKRLSDFHRVDGVTPTRGMLTQDPGQVSREMNLAKQQANTSNLVGARNLSQIQADNNGALVRSLDQMGAGAADDAHAVGQRAIDALQTRLGAQKAKVDSLYSAARDSSGRSFPLNGHAFADKAIRSLDDNLAGGSLPVAVREHINKISRGEVPFTVDYAEQLKTIIGRLQRNSQDGTTRYALGLVRQALDDAPVMPLGKQTAAQGARALNPDMLPATQGTELGEQAVSAFNQARSANRSMMKQVESSPAMKALYEGKIAPDNFLQKYIISSSVAAKDVNRLARMLSANPNAKESVKNALVQHLKDRALSGMPDDIGAARFSATNYTKALNQVGKNKLAAFFDKKEIEQLEVISRVGRLISNQPVGSAVNNSNTASALVGRSLDMLGSAGRGLKLFNVGEQIGAIQGGLRQRAAQKITPALSNPAAKPNRLLQMTTTGSLLAAPSVPGRE